MSVVDGDVGVGGGRDGCFGTGAAVMLVERESAEEEWSRDAGG